MRGNLHSMGKNARPCGRQRKTIWIIGDNPHGRFLPDRDATTPFRCQQLGNPDGREEECLGARRRRDPETPAGRLPDQQSLFYGEGREPRRIMHIEF